MSTTPSVTLFRTKTCKDPNHEGDRVLPLDQFHWKSKRKGTRQARCKSCMAKYGHEHYLANSDEYKNRANSRLRMLRAENRKSVKEWISAHPCQKCGEDSFKKLTISVESNEINNLAIEDLKVRLTNSTVLCRNCQVAIEAGIIEKP